MTIVAVGTTANLVVLLANGFLPVDPQALVAAGLADADALDRVVLGVGRRLQSGGEVVPVLGPVIGVRWLREAFSIGDLVLAAGIANVCFRLLWPTGSAVRARSAPAPAPAKAEEIAYAAAPPVDRTPAALDDDPTAPLVFGLSAADGNAARRGVAR
ncbi:MAG TPA: hypothetical protein DEP66_03820 [Acidimicrobiaceae bacterium]|nr:hypothetical protein [Acidimicrobiaceae bacterium]